MPNVLVDPNTRVWNGLTYHFMDPSDEKLADLSSWDADAYRVVSASSDDALLRYPHGFRDGAYLELLFSPETKGVQLLAQLDFSSACWLWNEDSGLPAGVVMFDAAETAEDFVLKLPSGSLKPISG